MLRQIAVIMKREWSDIITTFFSFNNMMAGLLYIGIMSGAASIYEPAKMSLKWLDSPIMIIFLALIIPLSIIGFIGPDSFVGERRRNTLEPLLVTPVSDKAILFGKIGLVTLSGWILVVLNMGIGLLTVNLSFKHEGFYFFPTEIVVGVTVLGFLISGLLAILGISSSLYSSTLLQAQNKMGLVIFFPMILVASFISPYTPEWWKTPAIWLATYFGTAQLFICAALILLIVDIALLLSVKLQFHRQRLVF
jgi:ABC-2 type transport system permease protein